MTATGSARVAALPRLGRQDALDGVRALAVLAVMARHALVPWLPGGGSGVFVFFTLSGFLITTLLLQEADATGRVRLGRFAGRRLRRLAPGLLLVVAGVVVLGRVRPDLLAVPGGQALLAATTYWGNWVRAGGGSMGPLDHTWSLAVEEQFYVVWPLVVVLLVLSRARPRLTQTVLAVALLGAAASLLLRVVLLRSGSTVERVYNGSDTEADLLLLGAAAAALLRWCQSAARTDVLARWAARCLVPGVALLALVLLAQPLPDRPAGLVLFFTLGLTGVGLATAALVLHVVLAPDSRVARCLALGPLPALGRLSYGLYLWHYPVFQVLGPRLPGRPYTVLLLGGGLALGLAVLSRELVERHLHRSGSV